MQRILIAGATSAIAEATARQFAARGDSLFLAARNAAALKALADDLRIRGAVIAGTVPMDAGDPASIPKVVDAAIAALSGLDQALIAYGTLTDSGTCETSVERLQEEFRINALSVMALCLRLAAYFGAQQRGVIAVISSVAGDRGRQSNYLYGAAKAAVTAFLSGLGQKLARSNVQVVVIKPGFVSTPMTATFPKGALWAAPARVARDIRRAMDKGTPVVYTPWFWRPIMMVVRLVPEKLFRRLSF